MANVLQAGESVPFSGAYKVVHSGQHNEAHYVLALRGETFSGSLRCSDQVKIQLALSAVHMGMHPFFRVHVRNEIRTSRAYIAVRQH
jgi:hypothetical protein